MTAWYGTLASPRADNALLTGLTAYYGRKVRSFPYKALEKGIVQVKAECIPEGIRLGQAQGMVKPDLDKIFTLWLERQKDDFRTTFVIEKVRPGDVRLPDVHDRVRKPRPPKPAAIRTDDDQSYDEETL